MAPGGSFLIPASFCGSWVLGLWPWPPPLPLSPNEGQGDLVREPHSTEAPVLRLWVDVNVGGMSLDPAACSSQFGFSQDPPRGAPLTGWDAGRAVGHSEWMLQGPPHAALGHGPLRHRAEPTPSPGNPATLTGCQQLEAPGQTPGAVLSGRVLRRAPCSSVLLRGPRLLSEHSGSTKTWPPLSRPLSVGFTDPERSP